MKPNNEKTIPYLIICEIGNCGKRADFFVRWGAGNDRCANTCEDHGKQIWEKTNHSKFWIQLPLNSIRN